MVDKLKNPERVKKILLGLKQSLQHKRAQRMERGLIPDEDMVLNSLAHPERGDVKIIVAEYMNEEYVYVSNKRDPDNPFAIMHVSEVRNHTGRRLLDPESARFDGTAAEYGLYLITVQDREILRHSDQVVFFSSALELNGPQVNQAAVKKTFDQLTQWERWEYLLKTVESDPNKKKLEEEFYHHSIQYSKYKQSPQSESLYLHPRKIKERLGMLSRDIYPNNMRPSLRRDFPDEHKKITDYLVSVLFKFKGSIENKLVPGAPKSYEEYISKILDETQQLIDLEIKTN